MLKIGRVLSCVGLAFAVAVSGTAARAEALQVSAAASLTDGFQEIGGVYSKQHPGDRVEFSFAGSQAIRMQIEQGAPVDVFASADLVQMQPLVNARLVDTAHIFTHNRLVVIASRKSGKVRSLPDLARPGISVVVGGPTVPVGRYTSEVLTKLGQRYGKDFKSQVMANVVSDEVSVRSVLTKVVFGEADAGFVYTTDAAGSGSEVLLIDIPARFNITAAYPIAVVSRTSNRRGAEAFMSLVLGRMGQDILAKHGFQK